MSECGCKCSSVKEEVDTSDFEEKKSTDPAISDYKDALEKFTDIIKTASQSKDGKELSDEYWKDVGQLLKKAKLGISMQELGIDPEDENPTNTKSDASDVTTAKDTEIEPMGDTRDGDQQFDVAKDEKEAADADAEKEKEEGGGKTPPPKKEEPPEDEEKEDSDEEKEDSDEEEQESKTEALNEKAKSATQQRLFGMVHAYQTGELDKDQVGASLWEKIKKIADGISNKDAEDIAKTTHDKIPERVPTDESTSHKKKLDEIRHLGIILESDECKVISSTYYAGGCVMEVSRQDRSHLLAIANDVVLEGIGYTFPLGNTSNFATVVSKFKELSELEECELIREYHKEFSVSVL